jgi:hypothetical protein
MEKKNQDKITHRPGQGMDELEVVEVVNVEHSCNK